MGDQTVSDAVRYLEKMRDEGFLSEEQFRREVRELLLRREDEEWEPPEIEVDGDENPARSVLADMVGHSRPVEFDQDDIASPETPAISGLVLEDRAPVPAADEPSRPGPRPEAAKPREAGRVIVKGKAPWDDKGHERVDLDGHSKLRKEDPPAKVSSVHQPLNPIQRERLARMAEKTNKTLNRRRNPETAFLLSLLLPGLGHAYFGDLGLGMGLMILGGLGWMGVFFGEMWTLYVVAPMGLLAGALIHRKITLHNNYVDMKRAAEARRAPAESRLNVERSIREAGAPPPAPRR